MDIVISDVSASTNPYINKIRLVHGDITAARADAIVTLIPQSLAIDGQINTAIDVKAGYKFAGFIKEHIYQPVWGDIYALPDFGLPCRHILAAVRPNWRSDFERDDKHLVMCTRKAMMLAKAMLLQTIAFPPLASSRKGYGKGRAARLLIQGILDRLDDRLQEVQIVCPDPQTYEEYKKRLIAKGWRGQA